MRARNFRARSAAAVLFLAGLGGAVAARAESEPCDCITERQSVVSETPCLIITAYAGCGSSRVRNACEAPVTLMGWPLVTCEEELCDEELQPNEEALFYFADGKTWSSPQKAQPEERFEEESFTVSVGGEERDVIVSASVSCRSELAPPGGCSSTSGGLALPGVLWLLAWCVCRLRDTRTIPVARV